MAFPQTIDIVNDAALSNSEWIDEMHYKGPLEKCDTARWANELHHKLVQVYADRASSALCSFQTADRYFTYYLLMERGEWANASARTKCYALHMCSRNLLVLSRQTLQ